MTIAQSDARTSTAGHWWTPDGFVSGTCLHDEWVHELTLEPRPEVEPIFLPAPVDLHVHGGGGHDCMSGDDALRGMEPALCWPHR